MKIYTDKDRIVLVQSVASANTFVSSITGIIKNYILKAFPKNYFANIYTDTSETYQEYNKNNLYNKSLYKIPYPSLTITPQLSIDTPVGGMKNILMSSPNMWIPRDLNRQFPLLLEDPDNKYKVYFTSDYTTLNLRFKIITDSFIQATNISYWLKSRFDDSTFKYMSDQKVQVEVPKSFIYSIAKIEGKFTSDKEYADNEEVYYTNQKDLEEINKFLIAISMNNGGMDDDKHRRPIFQKTSLNTGKECYFFEENEKLLTLFTDLDIPEGITRDNQVNAEYEINFRVQVSAWWPNAFIMSIQKDAYRPVAKLLALGSKLEPKSQSSMFYSTSIGSPILLDRKNIINFENETDNDANKTVSIGQNVVHQILTFDKSTAIKHLELSYFLNDEILKTHSYMLEHSSNSKDAIENISKFIHVIVRGYSFGHPNIGQIDYENLSVNFESPIDSDIVLDVFVNRLLYEEILAKRQNDKFYKDPDAITSVTVQSMTNEKELKEEKIRVYLFNSDSLMLSTETEKALRIHTKYGTGYIGLVQEDHPNATEFKVCLGFDKYNNAIIRCLERV